jgi:DNA-binding CsgD family transcriptional regulator
MKRGRPPYNDILTPREWQVLDLMAAGLTNEAIAERLGISFGAAKYHVAQILSKLGAETRQQAVEAAQRRRQRGVLPWLPSPRWGLGFATLAALSIVLGVIVLRGGDHRLAPLRNVPAHLDEAQAASPFPNTLLLTKAPPQNVGASGDLIASIRTVRTLPELRAILSPQINLIVVDRSAVSEIIGSDFVTKELVAGRAFLGLNVCFVDPQERFGVPPTPFAGLAWEISPTGEVRYADPNAKPLIPCQMPIPQSNVPYFSFQMLPTDQIRQQNFRNFVGSSMVRFGYDGSGIERHADLQGHFRRVLTGLDAGERTNLMPEPGQCEAIQPDGQWRPVPCPASGPR